MSNIINIVQWASNNRDKLTDKAVEQAYVIRNNELDAERQARVNEAAKAINLIPRKKRA